MSGATSLIVSLTGYLAIFNSSSLRQNDKFGTRVAFAEEWKATKNAAAEIFISTAVVARVLFQQTVQPVEDEYNRAIEEIVSSMNSSKLDSPRALPSWPWPLSLAK